MLPSIYTNFYFQNGTYQTSRRYLYIQLQKAKINFKKSAKERITKAYIKNRINNIDDKWKEFSKTHMEIVKCKETERSSYFQKDTHTEVEEFYLDFKSDLEEMLEEEQSQSVCNSETFKGVKVSKAPVKLPKITIPTFSGRYTEWIGFRDLFVSLIHSNKDLDNVQKLHYLKGHLTGEAEQLLRHIAITNDNYEQCWNLLEKRFNNKQFLATNILTRFFSQRNIVTESSIEIKQMLDNTTDMLQGLQNLGIDTSSWDTIVIYIVSQKLDNETRKQWEAKVSEITFNCNTLPDFKLFQDFLLNRFNSLEFLDSKTLETNFKVKNCKEGPPFNNSFYVSQITCSYCKSDHKISFCKEFQKLDHNMRRTFVQEHNLCFNCLANNHSVKYCRNTTSCQICKRRHHSLLHSNIVQSELQLEPITSSHQVSGDQPIIGSTHFSKGFEQISLLPTAIVYADSKNGIIPLRALIDQGSHISFITEAAVQLLGLKGTAVKCNFSGIGGETKVVSKSTIKVFLHSPHVPDCNVQVTAYVLDKLTGLLPPREVLIEPWSVLEKIKLADPDFRSPCKIDILLGSDVYGNILRNGFRKCSSGSLLAQETIFGWVLTGTNKTQSISTNMLSMHVLADDFLKSFWEIESEPQLNQKILSEEEQCCENFYAETTTRDDSGRYIVKLPFRSKQPACLGQSREIALKRFLALERKLERNESLRSEFKRTFDEYLELNHMRPVNSKDNKVGVYLPYHAVIREDKTTTKVRVVFDASCKGINGVSLNDDLMVGPTLQSELCHIIMRWRTYPICLSADITKMYRQIRVDEDDADVQHLLARVA